MNEQGRRVSYIYLIYLMNDARCLTLDVEILRRTSIKISLPVFQELLRISRNELKDTGVKDD